MKLNPKKVGLTCGIVWGAFLAMLTIIAVLFPPYGDSFLGAISSVYPGFTITWGGVFLGFVYGFIDAFVGGAVFVLLYNFFSKKY